MFYFVFQNSFSILLVTTTVGFSVLNLPPLNEAVKVYLDFKPYTPRFAECQCDKPAEHEVVVAAGDNAQVSVPTVIPEEKVETVEPVVERATGDLGIKDRQDIKFPVPYKRRSLLNSSGNATSNSDGPVITHVQTLGRHDQQAGESVNSSPVLDNTGDTLPTHKLGFTKAE